MYGIVTFSAINQIDEMTPGMYKFGYNQQFKPDDNGVLFSRYIAGGGVYHEGKIYCNVYNDEANLSTQKPVWTILNAETYEVLYEKELPDNGVCTTKSLAYDITNDKIYGIVVDFTDSHLVEIDPATGDMTRVGDNFDRNLRFKTLVSTNNGMLYSIVIDSGVSSLYKIRKTDGLAVKVRDITAKNLLGPDDYLFNSGTEQAMFLNRSTGKAYWILESNSSKLDSEYSPIFEVNLTNAEATMVSYLSRCYQVSGAWFKEPNNGAPGIISDFEYVTPEEGSASGSIQFRLPENDYRGNPFTDSNLKIKVVEGDKVLVDATAQAGTLFKSEELASYWKEYQERLRTPVEPVYPVADSTPLSSPGRRMRFFVGYTYSVESPYGVSVGGVGQRFGWYVRFKTNMSFMNYTGECNDRGEIIDFSNAEDESYEPDARQSSKTNSFAGSVGLIVKCCPWLYASVGLGYGKRTLLHAFTTHAYENYADTRSIWCKNMDSSYQGVMAEVDAMVRLGDMFFVSVGCNTLNFKYMDLNAGVGVFF